MKKYNHGNTGKKISKSIMIVFLLFISLTFYGCKKEPEETKFLMQGTWEFSHARDENDDYIKSEINFPASAIQITEYNTITGPQGPFLMYIANGDKNWEDAMLKFEEVFDYKNFQYNTSNLNIESGTPDRFTLELKLKAANANGSLTDLLSILGITNEWLQPVIYLNLLM
ncbi:MAG: hypothetical protein H0V01_12895 [Bacteroidetes bacterium]|nr:hypothetical protein [Bacteroidota bacterium]HET6244965.1 hypothetical protein [Bacteroidia bacterium]